MVGRYVKMVARPGQGDVMALLDGAPERIDLRPLGGVGLPDA